MVFLGNTFTSHQINCKRPAIKSLSGQFAIIETAGFRCSYEAKENKSRTNLAPPHQIADQFVRFRFCASFRFGFAASRPGNWRALKKLDKFPFRARHYH
jgi:hypothetical protein